MKVNSEKILMILCCIFALYGLFILVRKIVNRSEKNKDGKWSYYIEPFYYENLYGGRGTGVVNQNAGSLSSERGSLASRINITDQIRATAASIAAQSGGGRR